MTHFRLGPTKFGVSGDEMIELSNELTKRRARAFSAGEGALAWYRQRCAATMGDVDMSTGEGVKCYDPSTGMETWTIPESSDHLINTFIERARRAQPKWMKTEPAERAKILWACADALEAEQSELAEILALETGKSLTHECKGEVTLPASIFRYFSGLVHEIKGRSIQAGPKLMGYTTYHPWGVVAGVVPWNVPLMFMAYKIAAPLAAGNTVLIKAPEQATASLAYAFRLIAHLLPDGAVEIVSGSGSGAGNKLISNPGIDKVSFTGSVETGRAIYRQAAKDFRSVTLELGGKNPMIILEDCDLDKAVNGVIGSMRFTRAGQSCTASSRIYVPRKLMDKYREALGSALNDLKIGHALDPDTHSGPVVSKAQQTRIQDYLTSAASDGLDVKSYGNVLDEELFTKGYFVKPHLIFDPEHEHPVSQEEIFGPVATLTGYESLDDAIEFANSTDFGLSASVWGRDIDACLTCADAFRAGIVQINQNAIMLPGFSYGGIGISGVGKESSLEAMRETYMFEKTNIVNFAG